MKPLAPVIERSRIARRAYISNAVRPPLSIEILRAARGRRRSPDRREPAADARSRARRAGARRPSSSPRLVAGGSSISESGTNPSGPSWPCGPPRTTPSAITTRAAARAGRERCRPGRSRPTLARDARRPGAPRPASKPSTCSPCVNSCRPALLQCTEQPKRSAKRPRLAVVVAVRQQRSPCGGTATRGEPLEALLARARAGRSGRPRRRASRRTPARGSSDGAPSSGRRPGAPPARLQTYPSRARALDHRGHLLPGSARGRSAGVLADLPRGSSSRPSKRSIAAASAPRALLVEQHPGAPVEHRLARRRRRRRRSPGTPAAWASTGTIPKSSSPGNSSARAPASSRSRSRVGDLAEELRRRARAGARTRRQRAAVARDLQRPRRSSAHAATARSTRL